MNEPSRLRIALVSSVLARFDAISNDVVRMAGFLAETPGWEVSVLAGNCDRTDVKAHVMPRVSDLLMAPEFLHADVIIYHFGIYYPLFDAILVGNGRARQAVVFHNITPLELVPAGARPVIEKSFAQLEHLHAADAIWPVSRENSEMLMTRGFAPEKMAIQPLAVDRPPRHPIGQRSKGAIRIIAICRIVPSKGVQDLIEAIAQLDRPLAQYVHVCIVGSLEAAEPSFRETLLRRISELGLESRIEFAGALPDGERDRLLAESHILAAPSYHEGFCVPVIEALRAGMLPVVYSGSNLRYIADGLCVSAEEGNVAAFAAALRTAIEDMQALLHDPESAVLRVERGRMHIGEFEKAVSEHLQQFESHNVADRLRSLVLNLIAAGSERSPEDIPSLHV